MGGKVKSENYLVIQGFMINDLNLKGNELLVYAIIYGFSQEEGQVFSGSLQYLADWTSSTKQGVMKNLKSLVEKGYIVKNDKFINGVKFCEYYATQFNRVYNSVEQGIQLSLMGGIKHSLPNNIDLNNIDNNINNNIENSTSINSSKFKKPTLEEVKNYCLERNNNVDAENFIDFYESNGWKVGNNKMKDWKASVRTWERRNNKSTGTRKPIRQEKVPSWLYEEQKAEPMTPEELAEAEKLLSKFKDEPKKESKKTKTATSVVDDLSREIFG
jgi:hypothetical protein